MPRIFLKPKSPEFADDGKKTVETHRCDMPGCKEDAPHKAPKNRGLNDYYWFCLDHVMDYNKAWDFFSGMSQNDIENHIRSSFLWDRPTRRFDNGDAEDALRRKAWQTQFFTDEEPPSENERGAGFRFSNDPNVHASPEAQAMAIMGLQPPLDLKTIKARYKTLVKKYHPDVNPDDPKAEEMIKTVNMSYTILKLAYEKFEILEER
jgi:DnaJ-domain-containing protein 1